MKELIFILLFFSSCSKDNLKSRRDRVGQGSDPLEEEKPIRLIPKRPWKDRTPTLEEVEYFCQEYEGPHKAVCREDRSGLRSLLEYGEKELVNSTNKYGHSSLMMAARYGLSDIVSDLLARPGIKVGEQDNGGRDALMYALSAKHPVPIISSLSSEVSYQWNRVDHWGKNYLDLAVLSGITEYIKLFLDKGIKDKTHNLRLHLIKSKKADQFKLVQSYHEDIDDFSASGELFLVEVARTNQYKLINYLTTKGHDINKADHYHKHRPLTIAASLGKKETVLELLKYEQINVNLAAPLNDKSPITLAEENGHYEVAEILRAY